MDKVTSYKRLYFFLSALSLMSGMSVYFLFRNVNLLIFDWFVKLKWLNGFYIPVETKENLVLTILIYSVPDGLWLLSGIFFIRTIWLKNQKMCEVYVIVFFVMAVFFELFQRSEKMPGTFDVFDLFLMVSITFVEGIMYRFFIKRSLS